VLGRRSPADTFHRLHDPDATGEPRVLFDRAVVLGGSIAGLLAARVLADHARDVVVIEPDGPVADGTRPGAPHGDQLHILLAGGRGHLDRWFPGFSEQAVEMGSVLVPPGARHRYRDGRRSVPGAPVTLLSVTRPTLEGLLRRRTAALPNLTIARRRATGLEFTGSAVTGVRRTDPESGAEAAEPADFLVDAMGRSSRLAEWLERAGWEAPPMQRMPIRLNYATALFRRAEPDPPAKTVLSMYSPESGAEAAGAMVAAVEGERWMVLMAGYADNRPGRTDADFVRRCRADFPPLFGDVVSGEMLGPVRTFHQADSRRRDYHLVRRLPAGVVSVGDAVASFNPIYGQGMSSAALHAACLSAYLRAGPDPAAPARDFFELQRVVVDAAWGTSTSADLALPHIGGPYPRGYRLTRWAGDRLVAAAQVDPVIARRFDEVVHMLNHPSTLSAPGTLVRALRGARTLRSERRRVPGG
jgi:2-polyprenyl-6-methoxyphenol hydroxylase-like FAD-dependent oxidoreductase